MDIAIINKEVDSLCKSVANHRLSDVFKNLDRLINENPVLITLKDKIRKQSEIYHNLLRYSFTEVKDPERDKIYLKLLQALYKIIDELKLVLFDENKFFALNTLKQETNFDLLTSRKEVEKKLFDSEIGKSANKLFKKIWLSGELLNEDMVLLKEIIKSKKIPWVKESLIVSSLTISVLMNFDERKFQLLFDFYNKGVDKVWQRALVGIVFGTYVYSIYW